MHIPYVYLIKNKTTKLKYLGVRYAKGCQPADLWESYFTSSKLVNKLISEFGKDDWIIKILHQYPNDPKAAILKEAEYFPQIKKRLDYLNLCYSSGCLDLRLNSRSGKVGGKIVHHRKIGIFRSDEDRKLWASMGGKVGGKVQAELGLGFHKYKSDPKLHRSWASKGGKASGQFQNKKFQAEMGKRAGMKNKGSILINNGILNKKYTTKMQNDKPLDEWLTLNLSWSKGMVKNK